MSLIELIRSLDIPVVEVHPRFHTVDALLEHTKPLRGVEGFIVNFDGHRLKVKAEHYVKIHRTKDLIATERYIAEIIINERIDDVLPLLDEKDMETVLSYEKRFDAALDTPADRHTPIHPDIAGEAHTRANDEIKFIVEGSACPF
jgi:hypothetical protein